MPVWINKSNIQSFHQCSEEELLNETNIKIYDMDSLSLTERRTVHERFSLIANVLPFISDQQKRSKMIAIISEERKISKQTIRFYLCLYLAYQDITVLALKKIEREKDLSKDEKNMRWSFRKTLEDNGFKYDRSNSGHEIWERKQSVSIPIHSKEINGGIINGFVTIVYKVCIKNIDITH